MGMFASRFKSLRIKFNLSQQELADELGISKSSVSMYEREQREPDFETLEIIADFFNVDMNYLIGYSNDPHDWKKIGTAEGICPPKDYTGSYEEYVKSKMYEAQDALIDSYYTSHPDEDINEPHKEDFPPEIRAAARGMMELSPEDQKTAIDMINYLSQKGNEAKKN